MKRLILLALLLSLATGFAAADSQWDITVNIPYTYGFQSGGDGMAEISQFAFVIPEIKWNWYFGPEWLHVGLGVKMFTLIIESIIYPNISLESNLGNFVIGAGFGGGVGVYFGLANGFFAESLFIPEISVAYRLGKKKMFSIGTAANFLIAPGVSGLNEFIFIGTAFVRWTI